MKQRSSFISNSSSTSFFIRNTSDKEKTTIDFVKEIGLVKADAFCDYFIHNRNKDQYIIDKFFRLNPKLIFKAMLKDSKTNEYFVIFPPGEGEYIHFGSEHDDYLGMVFYYSLFTSGENSESFMWEERYEEEDE